MHSSHFNLCPPERGIDIKSLVEIDTRLVRALSMEFS